ncbi:hypothetical protein QBC34DRAFT_443920 [Podospora aff. communis PSN243]|uniref:Uncharacterized protein n=1 Tax=Podospora aff. communis PSN243 TaxID=3040156 RepID=A0AAV9G5L8_9PEZI|nr:hypothetical protein QBC34DRAFT_443920 [Podospora aff. communis PSN243]
MGETNSPSASQPTTGEPPPDYELSVYTHRHTMLATVPIDIDPDVRGQVKIYLWSPPNVQEIYASSLSAKLLTTIDGLTSLGAFNIPNDRETGFQDKLSSLLAASTNQQLESETLSDFMGQINDALPGRDGRIEQFFSFPVFSDLPDNPLGDGTLCPVWKWSKPDGVYRKSGFWEHELSRTLEDGSWTGGKGVAIMLGLVSEQAFYTIALSELGWKFTRLERAEEVASRGGDL